MTIKDDGGAAFPVIHPDGMGVQFFGVSVRDYFAVKAMEKFAGVDITSYSDIKRRFDFSDAASLCYQYADAMLKERAK